MPIAFATAIRSPLFFVYQLFPDAFSTLKSVELETFFCAQRAPLTFLSLDIIHEIWRLFPFVHAKDLRAFLEPNLGQISQN